MEEKKYPKVVKLDNGMYTFENPDGTRWKKEYYDAKNFSEGYAVVQPEKTGVNTVTFVDENGNEWEKKFTNALSFNNGLAVVYDENYFWTYADKDKNVWEEVFISYETEALPGLPGLMSARSKGGKLFYDLDHNFYTEEQVGILKSIYEESPERFLDLQTDDFKNKGFIKLACEAVKGYLVKQVESKKVVDDDYVNYARDLLAACEEKVKTANKEIEQSSKNKNIVLGLVRDFNKE